jgi:hypothetical protein
MKFRPLCRFVCVLGGGDSSQSSMTNNRYTHENMNNLDDDVDSNSGPSSWRFDDSVHTREVQILLKRLVLMSLVLMITMRIVGR